MLDKIFNMCSDHRNVKPIYIVKTGSSLYGTRTENSNTNYEVIVLPKKTDMLLGKTFDSSVYNSSFGTPKKDAYSIEFIPISIFLQNLYEKSEIYTTELAFSMSNREVVLYCHENMKYFFNNFKETFPFNVYPFISESKATIDFYKKENAKYYETHGKYDDNKFMRRDLYNAYRYLEEAKSLLLKKDIVFPLECAKTLKDIKTSKSISRTMKMLDDKFEEVMNLYELNPMTNVKSHKSFVENLINLLYE